MDKELNFSKCENIKQVAWLLSEHAGFSDKHPDYALKVVRGILAALEAKPTDDVERLKNALRDVLEEMFLSTNLDTKTIQTLKYAISQLSRRRPDVGCSITMQKSQFNALFDAVAELVKGDVPDHIADVGKMVTGKDNKESLLRTKTLTAFNTIIGKASPDKHGEVSFFGFLYPDEIETIRAALKQTPAAPTPEKEKP